VRFSVDTGGTFTDLVIEHDDGRVQLAKAPTVPRDPVQGVLAAFDVAAEALGTSRRAVLERGELFVHATTRAINAVLTGATARTAYLTTHGHPDILVFREGGRTGQFDHTRRYPQPYVPRRLTFEVPERVAVTGEVLVPLDEERVREIVDELAAAEIEAVGVCFLWSMMNAAHERRVGELLDELLPGVPYTLSHELNPTIREYRRASSTCIDASLKPLMTDYLRGLGQRIRREGFDGRVLMVTSSGGVLDADDVGRAPIHALGSGPAMAPVAGRHFAAEVGAETAIVADSGGTSYDVSLVRRGRIPWTREAWAGEQDVGFMTGFPAVDVRSIGAGGGSIGWVDAGGLLHVGPQSAGSEPGPACYGRGGTHVTVTDASLELGFIDPEHFLGGAMELDRRLAHEALERDVATPLGLSAGAGAAAMLRVVTERMVAAIEDITLRQGVDPATAVLVGGGGAAGLNLIAIARRLRTPVVIVPEVGPALSAAGALVSDLTSDFAATLHTTTRRFDADGVNRLLDALSAQCAAFAADAGRGSVDVAVELTAEGRYPHQVWDLEVPLPCERFESPEDVEQLRQAFHGVHREIFAISDDLSDVELLSWRARVRCRLRDDAFGTVLDAAAHRRRAGGIREVTFVDAGTVPARVVFLDELRPGEREEGPLVVESPWTTIVVDPGASVERAATGTLVIQPISPQALPPLEAVERERTAQ
jgi:N-methylhydantoinase A